MRFKTELWCKICDRTMHHTLLNIVVEKGLPDRLIVGCSGCQTGQALQAEPGLVLVKDRP